MLRHIGSISIGREERILQSNPISTFVVYNAERLKFAWNSYLLMRR